MAIIYEEQSEIWKHEFLELWKLQELYGDEAPTSLWEKLFKNAK